MNEDTREEYSAPTCKKFDFDTECLLTTSNTGDVGNYQVDKSSMLFNDVK